MRVALLGCGNVGGALAELLSTRQDDIAARTGIRLELVGIAVADGHRARPAAIPGELFGTDARRAGGPPRRRRRGGAHRGDCTRPRSS